jgi:hypothetical protein
MDPVVLGIIAGAVFASLEFALVVLGRWPSPRDEVRVLVASAANRFATGLIIPNVEIGVTPWAAGLIIGTLLALPVAAVGLRTVIPLGLGALGGITIAAVAELTT